jgi:DNA modification methylase
MVTTMAPDYQRQYEPILYGWKEGGDHYWCGARDQGDVWFFDKPVRNDLHPTMKPVALVERAIAARASPGTSSWTRSADPGRP